ncbi:hypothetical protein K438DRAFT_1775744 [Mycena galopus ATCC 62051]|nr:hypothetical protein K438DRAFT_1775744 [Mycena galopus ATCC 62051]
MQGMYGHLSAPSFWWRSAAAVCELGLGWRSGLTTGQGPLVSCSWYWKFCGKSNGAGAAGMTAQQQRMQRWISGATQSDLQCMGWGARGAGAVVAGTTAQPLRCNGVGAARGLHGWQRGGHTFEPATLGFTMAQQLGRRPNGASSEETTELALELATSQQKPCYADTAEN